jgi:hypothetical protein
VSVAAVMVKRLTLLCGGRARVLILLYEFLT